jgi:hypothetical protein
MRDRRHTRERRGHDAQNERAWRHSRRSQPDRRLNNIKVEWIPINHINIHPATRLVFSRK